MVTNNLKSFSDENIENIISRIQKGTVAYNLSDLKSLLAEVNTRKMNRDYVDILGELIKAHLETQSAREADVKNYRNQVAQQAANEGGISSSDFEEDFKGNQATSPIDDIYNAADFSEPAVQNLKQPKQNTYFSGQDEYEELDYEAFPTLSFLAGFYKVLGWVIFALAIVGGIAVGAILYKDQIPYMIGIIVISILTGTFVLLGFYAASEGLWLKMEIERHLRRLNPDK